ncbi:DUF2087 domain-containing protein [Kitasatospora sp. NPDC056138]|uniref:DUF2087 domain-containing protein n=1 Tax=Kitasatospora sp. NPDC056138 TaxID=3345724 RepID=UPI0035E2F273
MTSEAPKAPGNTQTIPTGTQALPGPDPQTEAVLRAFVREGRLTRLPAKRGKRIVVLEHVAAQSFRPGASYTEPEVNEILRHWCEGGGTDHAALRRDLVEEHLLGRKDGVYRLRDASGADPFRQDVPAPGAN